LPIAGAKEDVARDDPTTKARRNGFVGGAGGLLTVLPTALSEEEHTALRSSAQVLKEAAGQIGY
jgi:hypothetical protein